MAKTGGVSLLVPALGALALGLMIRRLALH
jgi:hypothetical protein